MYQNRIPNKVKEGLLVGTRKKTKAERAGIKHIPVEEFRNSMEQVNEGKTALGVRVIAIKGAMCTAAVETAGLTKAGTQRLLFMPGDLVPLWGTPQLKCDIVRMADISKTPDIRTRAYLPKWGAEINIKYISPQLNANNVYALLSNAGVLIGIGDYRQEKGKGAYGSFRVIHADQQDDEWDDLIANHGRAAQVNAIENPEYADRDTEDLMSFYSEEVLRRAG